MVLLIQEAYMVLIIYKTIIIRLRKILDYYFFTYSLKFSFI